MSGAAALRRPVLSVLGLLLAYYAVPLDWDSSTTVIAIGLVLTATGLGVLGRVMVSEVLQLRGGSHGRETGVLTMMLVLLVGAFAMAFYLLELLLPGQLSDLQTRTDALYFTLSTMTTVGYGDVHAEGQVARALVSGLIVFNVVVVAALVRALTRHDPPPR